MCVLMVRETGIEPVRHHWRQILSLLRLPITPLSLFCCSVQPIIMHTSRDLP